MSEEIRPCKLCGTPPWNSWILAHSENTGKYEYTFLFRCSHPFCRPPYSDRVYEPKPLATKKWNEKNE